jgi:uncharacterized protein
VGVSRNPKDFSRTLLQELRRRGYDVIPVNPDAAEIDGLRCYPHVDQIQPPVEGALLMTNSKVAEEVVRECHSAGVRNVWLYRATGDGAVSPAALAFGEAQNVLVVAGECPFMFLPETPWFHRVHGFCRKMLGTYPD